MHPKNAKYVKMCTKKCRFFNNLHFFYANFICYSLFNMVLKLRYDTFSDVISDSPS